MLLDIQQALEGQTCWYVSAGGATAPSFLLACGDKVARERPLKNERHPEEFRKFRGSVELLVWCSWRLQRGVDILASSDQEDVGLAALDQLVHTRIKGMSCTPPALDLEIRFPDDVQLDIICDHVEPGTSPNWELWTPEGYDCAGPGSVWQEES